MKIFLFRHGEVNNPKNIVYGRLPGFHLSKRGIAQVISRAQKLRGRNIAKIYTSPLERAQETAEIIAKEIGLNEKNITIKQDLTESDVMDWAGKSDAELIQKSQHSKNPIPTTDVEGLEDSGKRVFGLLEKIAKNNKNAVVVSHGDPIMGAIGCISGQWYSRLSEKNIGKGKYYIVEIIGNSWKVDI